MTARRIGDVQNDVAPLTFVGRFCYSNPIAAFKHQHREGEASSLFSSHRADAERME
jgi:hypothetical protein